MTLVRRLLAQRRLAAMIVAAALLMKLLLPAGYMIDSDRGRLTITICSGTAPRTVTMAMPGMHGGAGEHGDEDHAKPEQPCAFSGLSAMALGAVDPIQLAALIAFVMAAGLAGVPLPAPRAPAHLRPPLRGPPLRP